MPVSWHQNKGKITRYLPPWLIMAGNWKHRLFPKDVAACRKTSLPSIAATITSRWRGLYTAYLVLSWGTVVVISPTLEAPYRNVFLPKTRRRVKSISTGWRCIWARRISAANRLRPPLFSWRWCSSLLRKQKTSPEYPKNEVTWLSRYPSGTNFKFFFEYEYNMNTTHQEFKSFLERRI